MTHRATPYYFLKNLQGDVIAITDEKGSCVTKYSYDAWGLCLAGADYSDCGIADINPFRYRGYYYDSETRLYYLQSRYYDPLVARFINADNPQFVARTGANLFAYCKNDPVDFCDDNGYCFERADHPNSGWREYWGIFNREQALLFAYNLDTIRLTDVKPANGFISALSRVADAIGHFGEKIGYVASLGSKIFNGIEWVYDTYSFELDDIAYLIETIIYEKSASVLKIFFLFGSHDNQVKITDFFSNEVYEIVTLRTNMINELLTAVNGTGVTMNSRGVYTGYYY